MPLCFEIGEAFQFDWIEEHLVIAGIYHKFSRSIGFFESRSLKIVCPKMLTARLTFPLMQCASSPGDGTVPVGDQLRQGDSPHRF